MMRRALFAIVLAVVAAASAVPAAAHGPAAAPLLAADPVTPELLVAPALVEVVSAAAAPVPVPWAVVVLTGFASLALARRPRQAVALLLVVVSAVFTFETAVHSAHHLGTDASSCSVASVAAQLSGAIDGTVVCDAPNIAPVTAAFQPDVVPFVSGVLSPDAGRAPPLPSA